MENVQSADATIKISGLVRYEFLQAVWFEVWRRSRGLAHGFDATQAQSGLAAFDFDLEQGVWHQAALNWDATVASAERLITTHTVRHGARSMDLLHVATALELGATEFLSFDLKQRRIAEAEGLVLPL